MQTSNALLKTAAKRCSKMLLGTLTFLLFFGAANAQTSPSNQLILLFDPTNSASPTPSEIISEVNSQQKTSALLTELGNPTEARSLLTFTSSAEFKANIASNPLSARALLEDYVVLIYESSADATSASNALSSDARVLSVQTDVEYSFSAVPIDTFYAFNPAQPFEGNYQWGPPVLNLPTAWDLEFGHAYVADIDTGIPCDSNNAPCTRTTHPDLKKNFRTQFSAGLVYGVPSDYYNDVYGHGTHTAGIIAATPEYPPYFSNGDSNTGVAGTCWSCSLAMLTTNASASNYPVALTYAADHGMQVANMSFGDDYSSIQLNSCSDAQNPQSEYYAACLAISYAAEKDVVMVASSGNRYEERVAFPARDPRVIAVGGLQYPGVFFRDGYGYLNGVHYDCTAGVSGPECGSNYGPEQQLVAPAKDVISTFPYGALYNGPVHCGDSFGPPGSNDGYGDCTGTSMSAPYVTGIVGLLRSVNPLMGASDINAALVATATPCAGTDSDKCGAGIPDAAEAIHSVLGGPGAVNFLTPLFEFYSDIGEDHFFTTSPQMAMAALDSGMLLPQPPSADVHYDPNGSVIYGYDAFPYCSFNPCPGARATMSIFASMHNPSDGSLLVPLFRYSFACDSSITFCNTRPSHVSHVYSPGSGERSSWENAGYKYDGVEGYIYSKELSQPPGTVKMCRKYDSARDDYAMFPGGGKNGTDCSATDDGTGQDGSGGNYSQSVLGTNWIGWVYPVSAPQSVCANGLSCDPDLAVSIGDGLVANVTNVSGVPFTDVYIRVTLSSGSEGFWFDSPPECSRDTTSPGSGFGSFASFTCLVGAVSSGASSSFEFYVTQQGGAGALGTVSVELITPTTPVDTNSQNNTDSALRDLSVTSTGGVGQDH